jgi:hypothetical protein
MVISWVLSFYDVVFCRIPIERIAVAKIGNVLRVKADNAEIV